jgi:hypothetical protein
MVCKHWLVSVAKTILILVLVTTTQTAIADMPVTFMELEPTAGVYYGWGYNMTTQQFTSPCLGYNSSATYPSGDPDQGSAFEFAENTATIAAKSNLTVSASLKVLAGGGTYKANNKTSVAGGTESSTYSQSLFANAYRYDVPEFLDLEQVTFKSGPLQLLNTPGGKGQFKQQCGDGFVIGIQKGREFIGTATVTQQSLKTWTQFANETGASASGAWGNVEAGVNIGEEMEQAFGSNNISVNTYSTGSNQANPTKAGELKDYFQKFLNSSGPEKMTKVIVAPYNLVENYPWENPLKENTKDDYIGMMVVSLWELRAAISDADFILNPTTTSMFALGLNAGIKARRKNYIKRQREVWQKEYDMLLKAALKCDKDFTGQCQELAEFYDRHRNLAAQWYAVLPERYLSDCYQPLILKDFSNLKNDLASRSFGTPVKGDSETSGTKGRVVAELTFRKDQRQLKADLSVAKIQWKRKEWKNQPIEVRSNKGESGWGLKSQAIVFDLDKPQQYGLGQENLKSCTWLGEGIQIINIGTPTAANYFNRFGFSQRKTNGYIDGVTGGNPRGQQMFANGLGALDFITCEVDRKGKDNNMQCLDLGVRNLRLTLCSQQDLAANQWRQPATPQVPTVLANFSSNRPVALAKNAQQYKVFTSLVPATQRKQLSQINAKKASATGKFKTTRYKLPAKQVNLMKTRLQLKKVSPKIIQPKKMLKK